MSNGRRVRIETGWRSLACSVCGPDTTHALICSGLRRWRWVGPPSGEVREYALCLACGTRRSQHEEQAPLSWTDALARFRPQPVGAD